MKKTAILLIVSALAPSFIVVVWIASYRTEDPPFFQYADWPKHWTWNKSSQSAYTLALYRGKIILAHDFIDVSNRANSDANQKEVIYDYGRSGFDDDFGFGGASPHHQFFHPILGFGYRFRDPVDDSYGARAIAVPCWALLLLILIPSVRYAARIRRIWIRQRKQLCLRCGYDVRESVDRCPECGAPITSSP